MMDSAFLAQIALSAVMPFQTVECPQGFETVNDDPWLRLLVRTGTPFIASERGVLVGKLYSRAEMQPVGNLSPEVWCDILATEGRALVEHHWGNYVAFLRKPGPAGRVSIIVLRAPLGTLDCYWHQKGEKLSLASSPGLLADAGLMTVKIDPVALARHIAQPEIATSATCLVDLHALEGGHRLNSTLPAPELHQLWSPWQFCEDRPGVMNHIDAAVLIRDVLNQTVAAQTAEFSRVLLMLSGGLDSSILAACLHHAGREVHGFNLVTETAKGDERHFAQLAARATGAKLTEVLRNAAFIDLSTSRASRASRPYARSFTQESDQQAALCARQAGADVVLDGGGGDNLFFNNLTLAALVEVLRKCGPGPRFWRTSAAFADLTTVGLASVLIRTLVRALLRGNRLRFEMRDTYLSPEIRAGLNRQSIHPWHNPPKGVGPGKAAHVALLAPARAAAEQGQRRCEDLPSFSPLVCQPVIETVLSLPIWCWFAPGLNRAAVRLAFKHDLPPALIERRTKGTPAPFISDLFEKHRAEVCTMLLDGRLAEMGILDLDRLRRVLDDPTPARDLQFARIMELVDAEAWARSWD